jgi:hypothetical protein
VAVKLDFGKGTWDLELPNADLSGHLDANAGNVQLTLVLNEKYSVKHDLEHHVDMDWRWTRTAKDPKSIEVTSYEGRSDSATQNGEVSLEGTLPRTLSTFGDMTFEVNRHVVHVPLIEREDFLEARANGGRLVHDKDGVRLVVDFGRKIWTARFEREAFHQLMAPVRGTATVRVRVRGATWGTSVLHVEDFTTRLKLDS